MSEAYADYILYGLLALVVIASVFALFYPLRTYHATPRSGSADEVVITERQVPGFKPAFTGSTEMGDVSIGLTPLDAKGDKLIVDFAANTHSVDLSQFDLKRITTLEYDGKVISPEFAPSLGGHHSKGRLVFDVKGELSKGELSGFTIRIIGIPKVEERVFEWGRDNKDRGTD